MYDWAELRHFRYLLTILEKQGFRVAADELHTSQPNLTVQARQFQENASVRLFRRMKNGRIRPTDTGIAFIALARVLLETRDEVIDALMAIERGEISSVRFGCTPLVDPSLFRELCGLHKDILPACTIRLTHGDAAQLAEEILTEVVDAAIVTLPLKHPNLQIESLRRDRLVVCLRRDSVLARKSALQNLDLQENLTVLYHPKRHPEAHERLLELLREAGIEVREYSHASHPLEIQALVKEGHGLSLIREGTVLDDELTTRPVAGVSWTVDTAVIYHKQRHPKTIPILVKKLRRELTKGFSDAKSKMQSMPIEDSMMTRKRPSQSVSNRQARLLFPGENRELSSR
jgi:DNA-binding transcriptional LysR family regulator